MGAKKRGSKLKWIILVVVLLLLVVVVFGGGGDDESASTSGSAGVATTDADAAKSANAAAVASDAGDTSDASATSSGVNADSFAAIQSGMSYEDVVALMGSEGELTSESEAGGSTSQLYQWESDGWGIAQVMFMDGKVVNKTQLGIGSDSALAVTAAQYDQVAEGMSYDDVVGIMGGEGQLVSDTNVAGISSQIYTWDGSSLGSNCTITFSNGVVYSKSQYGLE